MDISIPLPGDLGSLVLMAQPGCATWAYWLTCVDRPKASWQEKVRSYNWILSHLAAHHLVETCGGLGLFATLAQTRGWDSHVVCDISPESISYINSLGLPVQTLLGDATSSLVQHKWLPQTATIVDYPMFTLLTLREAMDWRTRLFEYLKQARPEYLCFTDTANTKWHLNAGHYSRHLGTSSLDSYYSRYTVEYPGYKLLGVDSFRTKGGGGAHVVLSRV